MQNDTDIIISSPGTLGDTVRKIDIDQHPDRVTSFRRGVVTLLMFPSNPVTLALDCICWLTASSLLLLITSLWQPVGLLWGLWVLYVVTIIWLPTHALGGAVRLAACIRLMLVVLGCVALLV